jgi:hypothetical protein
MARKLGEAASLHAGSGAAEKVASAQFVQQLSQAIRKDGLRPHKLLQTLADGVANGP